MYIERHYIIIPANLEAIANAEAIKWDPDDGSQTFSVRLTSDGSTVTHLASCGLIDVGYLPPGQGGQTALDVLDAFYATGHYKGYRIQRPQGNLSALIEGDVEAWRPARMEDGVPVPAGWVPLGQGRISTLALADAGLSVYVESEGGDEIEAWVQPTGSHDSYPLGARVIHGGLTWESTVDNNVWEPGVFGWSEVA